MPPAERLVVVPTYNERDNVAPLVEQVRAQLPGCHLLFVDDASPDGTAAAVTELARKHPGEVHLLERPGKEGLGVAYRAGFAWALEAGYPYVFQMDADHSHRPEDLPGLFAPVAAGEADFALGSRWVAGGGESFTFLRRLTSRGGSLYARTVLGVDIKDLTGGFKCWKREVLEALDLDRIDARGYAFQIETTYRALKRGFRAVEVPIQFSERAAGESKMSGRIMVEALLLMWRLRWKLRSQ